MQGGYRHTFVVSEISRYVVKRSKLTLQKGSLLRALPFATDNDPPKTGGMVFTMMFRLALTIAAVGAVLSGCSSDSKDVLAREVNSFASVGMSRDAASRRLEANGFKCGSNYEANFTSGDVLCSRARPYYVVATCVQRAFLTLDDRKQVVRHIATPKPSCTGL
jgi:hypothetical protein